MIASGGRDDEFFDFSDQILGEQGKEEATNEAQSESPKIPAAMNYQGEVHTSYLLVNALLNLLIRKGIIYPHEVNTLVGELHEEYMKKKGKG